MEKKEKRRERRERGRERKRRERNNFTKIKLTITISPTQPTNQPLSDILSANEAKEVALLAPRNLECETRPLIIIIIGGKKGIMTFFGLCRLTIILNK